MLERLGLGGKGLEAGCKAQGCRALGWGGCLPGFHIIGAVSAENRERQGEERGQNRGWEGREAKWASAQHLQRF